MGKTVLMGCFRESISRFTAVQVHHRLALFSGEECTTPSQLGAIPHTAAAAPPSHS